MQVSEYGLCVFAVWRITQIVHTSESDAESQSQRGSSAKNGTHNKLDANELAKNFMNQQGPVIRKIGIDRISNILN